MPLSVIQGILISFAGTSLGARWPSCSRGQISRRAQRSLTHSRAILSGLSCPLLVERDSEGASVFRLAHELHHAVGPLDGVTHERESQARATTLA